MTLQEFKAWFEGFCENLDGPPNAKQWRRIKARVGDIDGCSVTPIIVERWRDRYVPNWPYREIWGTTTIAAGSTGGNVGSINFEMLNDGSTAERNGSIAEKHEAINLMLSDMGREESRALVEA